MTMILLGALSACAKTYLFCRSDRHAFMLKMLCDVKNCKQGVKNNKIKLIFEITFLK